MKKFGCEVVEEVDRCYVEKFGEIDIILLVLDFRIVIRDVFVEKDYIDLYSLVWFGEVESFGRYFEVGLCSE